MPTVDFVYDEKCPNVKTARANLMRAFSRSGIPANWVEHQIGHIDTPPRVRGYGSPTILVDGVDVSGLAPGTEDCCRIYASGGAPDVGIIAAALSRAETKSSPGVIPITTVSPPERRRWSSTLALLPGIGVALMPKVVCPLCWPAYAGVLSAAGLTFLMEDRWLLPISAALLAAALGALAWRATSRRGYGPLRLGTLSATAILIAKFAMDSTILVYAGIAGLVAACLWNVWPQRLVVPYCPACPADENQ